MLYICLCGFPPFSDELCTEEHPYNLSEQIRRGMYDFPSPYWDSVGDAALDLIEHMLEVNVGRRYTIDQCIEHPWMTGRPFQPADSFTSITNGMGGLGFTRKRVERERTLLAQAPGLQNPDLPNPSRAQARAIAPAAAPPSSEQSNGAADKGKAKADEEEEQDKGKAAATGVEKEESLDMGAKAFVNIGGKGPDETLYGDERYPPGQAPSPE